MYDSLSNFVLAYWPVNSYWNMHSSDNAVFLQFFTFSTTWRYVRKILPTLACNTLSSLSPFQHLIVSPFNRLFIYNSLFVSFITLPKTHIYVNYFNHSKYDYWLCLIMWLIIFLCFINFQFLDYCLLFTDGFRWFFLFYS